MKESSEDRWRGSPAKNLLDAVERLGAALDEEPLVLPPEFMTALCRTLMATANLLGQQQGLSVVVAREAVRIARQK